MAPVSIGCSCFICLICVLALVQQCNACDGSRITSTSRTHCPPSSVTLETNEWSCDSCNGMTRSKNNQLQNSHTHAIIALKNVRVTNIHDNLVKTKNADLKSLWVWVAVCSLLLQRLHVLSSRDSESLLMSIWCHTVIQMDDRDTEMLKPHILCLYRPNHKCTYIKMASCPRKDMKYIFSQ